MADQYGDRGPQVPATGETGMGETPTLDNTCPVCDGTGQVDTADPRLSLIHEVLNLTDEQAAEAHIVHPEW